MQGQIWFCEVNVAGYWSMVGTPCDTRAAARIERDKYKSQHPWGHYRVRRYNMDPRSRG